jgi:hypothetical protein
MTHLGAFQMDGEDRGIDIMNKMWIRVLKGLLISVLTVVATPVSKRALYHGLFWMFVKQLRETVINKELWITLQTGGKAGFWRPGFRG